MEDSGIYRLTAKDAFAIGFACGEREGSLEEARKVLLIQGEALFGPPPHDAITELNNIQSHERLDRLFLRILNVASWDELLNLPRLRARRLTRNS